MVCASVLRSLPPATPPASPVARALAPARGMLGRVLYAAAFFLLSIYKMDSQPTDKVEGVGDDKVRPFKPSAPPRRHCQRPQLVKGKSPQGSRITVQIEQYLLCSAAKLSSCSFSAATASRLTSSMLPHVSLDASQLLKPAYVDTTAKLRPQASFLALRAAGANQLLKPASTTLRSYGAVRQAPGWRRFELARRALQLCG